MVPVDLTLELKYKIKWIIKIRNVHIMIINSLKIKKIIGLVKSLPYAGILYHLTISDD